MGILYPNLGMGPAFDAIHNSSVMGMANHHKKSNFSSNCHYDKSNFSSNCHKNRNISYEELKRRYDKACCERSDFKENAEKYKAFCIILLLMNIFISFIFILSFNTF